MTEKTRLNLGKIWKERLDNPSDEFPVPKQVTKDHPHIKEYEASLKKEEEPEPEPEAPSDQEPNSEEEETPPAEEPEA